MLRYLSLAAVLFAAPALAQQAPQPSSAAQSFAASHQLQMCLSDDSGVTARAYDIAAQLQAAQQQVATLQAQLEAFQKVRTPKAK